MWLLALSPSARLLGRALPGFHRPAIDDLEASRPGRYRPPPRSEQQVLILQTEHRGTPIAAVVVVLIRNMLARGHEIRENSAER